MIKYPPKFTQTPKLHKSCSTLSIYAFYNILKSNDLRFLIKNYNEYENKDKYIGFKYNEELNNIFKLIFTEYKGLLANKKSLLMHKAEFKLLEMKLRYSTVSKIIKLYKDTKEIEVLGLLNDWGESFSLLAPISDQIYKAERSMIGLQNLIRIKDIDFERKYNKKVDDDLDILKSLDKEALYLEAYLELGYNINVRKTTVERWINLHEMRESKDKVNG